MLAERTLPHGEMKHQWQVLENMYALTEQLNSFPDSTKVFKLPEEQTRQAYSKLFESGLVNKMSLVCDETGRSFLGMPDKIYLVTETVRKSGDPHISKWDEGVLTLRFQYKGKGSFVEFRTSINQYCSLSTLGYFHTDLGFNFTKWGYQESLNFDQSRVLLALFKEHTKGEPIAENAYGLIRGSDGRSVEHGEKFPW